MKHFISNTLPALRRRFLVATATVVAGTFGIGERSLAQESDNWGNWRGPNYTGAVDGVSPPTTWDGSTNIKWKTAIPGAGSGSPIVWGDRIYVVSAIATDRSGQPDMDGVPTAPSRGGPGGSRGGRSGRPSGGPPGGQRGGFGGGRGGPPQGGRGGRGGMNNVTPNRFFQFAVLAYDKASGKEVWKTIVNEAVPHEGGHTTNTHASGSPVTDGNHIYVSFGSYGVYCLDMDGNKIWKRDLGKMTTRNAFGEASSPALHDDTLVVPWDQDGYQDKNGNGSRDDGELLSSIVGLDAKTGEIKWRTPRASEPTTWATPLIIPGKKQNQVVMNGTTVRSYDLETGEQIWECGGQVTNPIPTPIPFGDSVICMTGYRGNAIYSMAWNGEGKLDGTDKVNWSRNDAAPYVASGTLHRGQLYFTKSRDGIMSAVNAETGEVIIPQKRINGVRDLYASVIAAGDYVYFTGRDGTTTVIKHGDDYEQVSVNQLGEAVDASLAVSGNQIFIRAAEHLYCVGE
ncbi:MAG: PQQ-binding-like beta-propeller repeat protein [Planctomycetota bacterium]